MTDQEAYLAMFAFLDTYYSRNPSAALGEVLGNISLLQDGSPADPAVKEDWARALNEAKSGRVNAQLILGLGR